MTTVDNMLARLMAVQRRNTFLTGPDLVDAASAVVRLARKHHAVVVASDPTGERIVGAALAVHPDEVAAADTTTSLVGQTILVVSGAIAGPVGLTGVAARLRSLGATALHAGVLDGTDDPINGYETVGVLTEQGPAVQRPKRRPRPRARTSTAA